jgi:hypothetical protein
MTLELSMPSMSLPLHFIIPVSSSDLRGGLGVRLTAREKGERRSEGTRDEGRGTKGVMVEKPCEGTFRSKEAHCETNEESKRRRK